MVTIGICKELGRWNRGVSLDVGFKGIDLGVGIPTTPFASSITSSELLSIYALVFSCVKQESLFLP